MPYNPADVVTMTIVNSGVMDAFSQLGVELLPSEVGSVDEMLARVDTLPEDTIIYLLSPLSSLEGGLEQLSQRAKEHGVPVFSTNREVGVSPFPVANYTVTFAGEAQQGANMVDRVLKGQKPADMPVETAEYFLDIDLKSAAAYGIAISDEIIKQANVIIR
ncbi:MAG: ABC transporter substrate binding protein [Anaerolineales bacterium]